MKRNYLIGYVGDIQCVYGKDSKDGDVLYVEKMTLAEAKKRVAVKYGRTRMSVFKLVKVKL